MPEDILPSGEGAPRGAHLATLGASSSTTVLSGYTQSGDLGESALAGPVSGSEPVSGLSPPALSPGRDTCHSQASGDPWGFGI